MTLLRAIGVEMLAAGLSKDFVLDVMTLASRNRAAEILMQSWHGAQDLERAAIVSELFVKITGQE